MRFSGFDSAGFLRDHWQKRPLLIRDPWPDWRNPLEPDELAGLACEDGIEARLVTRAKGRGAKGRGAKDRGARDLWKVEHGPFREARFARTGKQPWTLLVQAVDHHVPQVAALIAPFRFVPNWRIDDVMVSYASDGGGVGPHFDRYDVFLVQGAGRRRWRIGAACDDATALLPHDDLRLLADFVPTEEFVLEAGDILYVPPGVAHDGVAEGDGCMTYSIGFRAPSRGELVAQWSEHLLDTLPQDDRYADPGLPLQANPGEIAAPAIAALHAMVTETLNDHAAFVRWFGRYTTARKYPEIDWQPDEPIARETVREWVAQGVPLCRNPASRFSFVREADDTVLLFVDGECLVCAGDTAAFAEQLCANDRGVVDPAASSATLTAIGQLVDQGSVAFEPDE